MMWDTFFYGYFCCKLFVSAFPVVSAVAGVKESIIKKKINFVIFSWNLGSFFLMGMFLQHTIKRLIVGADS